MFDHPPLYILRHGETEWNREARCQGNLDAPLTELGQQQAAAQGMILREQVLPRFPGIDVAVSPLGRTRKTWALAAGAAGHADLPHRIEPRLAEVHMGVWQGRLRADILALDALAQSMPNVFELSLAAPAGEDFEALHARLVPFIQGLTRPTICVTHGITSLMLRGLLRGLDRSDMAAQGHDQGVIYALADGEERILRPVMQD